MAANDHQLARRVGRILEQVDELPTLGVVAVRLLEVTGADDTDAGDVVELVASDPALSSKVLALCRRADRGVALRDASIERAVVLLGFETVRAAVLSVQVFEMFEGRESCAGEQFRAHGAFDRLAFWHHSLAVAAAAEKLAAEPIVRQKVKKSEAFLAGLLHDLGQIAVHFLLPKTFDRIAEAADTRAISIDQAARLVLGMDTHTVGKRLAEHWQLPAELIEAIWLNGQSVAALPTTTRKELIATITLADLIARDQMLHPAGHGPRGDDGQAIVEFLGLNPERVREIASTLHEEVEARATGLGLPSLSAKELVNRSLERANELLRRRDAGIAAAAHTSDAPDTRPPIIRFLDESVRVRSLVGVFGMIARTAGRAFGLMPTGFVLLPRGTTMMEVFICDGDGRLVRHEERPLPEQAVSGALDPKEGVLHDVPAWLKQATGLNGPRGMLFGDADAPSRVALLINGAVDEADLANWRWPWHAAIQIALEYEHARHMSEQLAESHRLVHEMQEELSRSRAMASLGELAAGAAHEMNNPLTVISGRSQLIASRANNPSMKSMATEVVRQAHRLSDLITSLKVYAEEPKPNPKPFAVLDLVESVVREVRERASLQLSVQVKVAEAVPVVKLDADHVRQAIRELVLNAAEAQPSSLIEVRVHIDPLDDRLMIEVIDDGYGLSEHAVRHAFDPFFSEKPAGRRPGLGLARARRLVEANHGRITLRNRKPRGAIATIAFEQWRIGSQPQRSAA